MMYTSFDNTGILRVLSYLKSHNSEFLSGQDLSDVLKISRVAVWKHVKKIRSLGYKVESKHHLGYKLTDSTDLLLPWEVTQNLDTKLLGKRAFYFDTIDSTQNFAAKIASNHNENGTIIVSKHQTDGKGRLKRKWESPTGGIWMSIIIQPEFNISYITLVPIATSLALCIAIEKILKIKPKLKWPNDVLVENSKISGVLLESFDDFIVAGIGLNILNKPQNEIKWKTTKLYDHINKDFSLKHIANVILKITFKNYAIWEDKGFNFFNISIKSLIIASRFCLLMLKDINPPLI